MSLEYTCSQCGQVYRKLSNRLAGKKVRCKCGHTGRAPLVAAPPIQIPRTPDRPSTSPPAKEGGANTNSSSKARAADDSDLVIQDDFSDLDQLLSDD